MTQPYFFHFPWPPGHEPKDDPRVEAIAQAARELVEKRNRWLNPKDEGGGMKDEAEIFHPSSFIFHPSARTLTNFYNQRPTWPDDLSDEEILARLLGLNLERAGL